jgi:putative SOS response-associated peptidase YedK
MQTHSTNVFDDESPYAPSFNVAPQTFQPVVRLARDTGERELTVMRWGLIPYWSNDGKPSFSMINAKAETVTTSPAFRDAMKRRRCLVPARQPQLASESEIQFSITVLDDPSRH